MILPDTPKYQNWRTKMVKKLRERGITDERVLSIMQRLPRHVFAGETALDYMLYDVDYAVEISCGQTISRPYTVAWQSQLLELKPMDSVLEVGTGSGYQTAILCELGAQVFTVERQDLLFRKTKALLAELRYSAKCYLGDSFNGLPEMRGYHFDRILVTCGAPEIPEGLMNMLKVGGMMVIPVGIDQQRMLRVTKNGESRDQWTIEDLGDAKFVPMLAGKNFIKNKKS